jgi:hypothetical protein
MDYVNTTAAGNTPMAELMALGFAVHDLGLYLDTHQEDTKRSSFTENTSAF